jgi:excisionase family DNA binding protein
MSPQFITVREAAQRLGLSYDRTRVLLVTRKLKGTQSGGRYGRLLADAADLERLVRERRPRAL